MIKSMSNATHEVVTSVCFTTSKFQKTVNANTKVTFKDLTDEEINTRRNLWKAPKLKATSGVLYKYAKTVSSASTGCVTDEF